MRTSGNSTALKLKYKFKREREKKNIILVPNYFLFFSPTFSPIKQSFTPKVSFPY